MSRRRSDGSMRKAKVVLVGNYPPPWGGISVHVQELRDRLRAEGARVEVLAVGGAPREEKGITTVGNPVSLAGALASYAARGYLAHVHISGHTTKSWLIALAAGIARTPLAPAPILTLHSGLVPNYLAVSDRRRRLVRTAAAGFGRIIAVNPVLAKRLEEIGVNRRRITIAPAFFPEMLAPGTPPPELLRVRAKFRPLLSAAVTASPLYGSKVLLQALALLSHRFPEAGAALFGPESDGGAVRAMAKRYGVEDRVHFLGQLGRPASLAVMLSSDVFVRPTYADGDALSVREALALGRPVVASAVGFRPEGTVTFRTGDPLALADVLGEVLSERRPVEVPALRTDAVFRVYRRVLGIEEKARTPEETQVAGAAAAVEA